MIGKKDDRKNSVKPISKKTEALSEYRPEKYAYKYKKQQFVANGEA